MTEIYLANMEVPQGKKKRDWERAIGKKLLLLGLKEKYGLEEKELDNLQIAVGSHGKPYLKEFPQIHYNISHTDGMVICGFCDREIGVDVEKIRPYGEGILKKVLSDSERSFLINLPEEERNLYFFKIWTLKESYGKAVGCGLFMDLTKLSFTLKENKAPLCSIPGYSFYQNQDQNGYMISLCVEGEERTGFIISCGRENLLL